MYQNQSIATDCRTFQPRRYVYSMYSIVYVYRSSSVSHGVDKGLHGRNIRQSVDLDRFCYVLYLLIMINLLESPNTSLSHNTTLSRLDEFHSKSEKGTMFQGQIR